MTGTKWDMQRGESSRNVSSQKGQAIAEFAIAFPLQLLIMLSIMQLALIYVGKQVVTYAAYQAARSALVAPTAREAEFRAQRAAALICSPITGPTISGSNVSPSEIQNSAIGLPGWGELPGSGVSNRLKTHVAQLKFLPPDEVEATVTHYYELTLPVVGFLFGSFFGNPAPKFEHGLGRTGSVAGYSDREHEENTNIWNISAPHMRLKSTARVAAPGVEQ